MRTLDQQPTDPEIAFASLAAQAFAGTLVVAWTHTCPRGHMLGTGKPTHVYANFGQQPLGRQHADPCDLIDAFDRSLPGQRTRLLLRRLCLGGHNRALGLILAALSFLLWRLGRGEPARNLLADPPDGRLQALNLL